MSTDDFLITNPADSLSGENENHDKNTSDFPRSPTGLNQPPSRSPPTHPPLEIVVKNQDSLPIASLASSASFSSSRSHHFFTPSYSESWSTYPSSIKGESTK